MIQYKTRLQTGTELERPKVKTELQIHWPLILQPLKATLIVRPLNLVANWDTVYYWAFVRPAAFRHSVMVPWVAWNRDTPVCCYDASTSPVRCLPSGFSHPPIPTYWRTGTAHTRGPPLLPSGSPTCSSNPGWLSGWCSSPPACLACAVGGGTPMSLWSCWDPCTIRSIHELSSRPHRGLSRRDFLWHRTYRNHGKSDTVKLVYKDYLGDHHNVVLIHRWSLYTGTITWKVYPWGPIKCCLYKHVIFRLGLTVWPNTQGTAALECIGCLGGNPIQFYNRLTWLIIGFNCLGVNYKYV